MLRVCELIEILVVLLLYIILSILVFISIFCNVSEIFGMNGGGWLNKCYNVCLFV